MSLQIADDIFAVCCRCYYVIIYGIQIVVYVYECKIYVEWMVLSARVVNALKRLRKNFLQLYIRTNAYKIHLFLCGIGAPHTENTLAAIILIKIS